MYGVRVWQRARQGWGWEDIYVALRHIGVTLKYAKSVVTQVEAKRARYYRERVRARKEVA